MANIYVAAKKIPRARQVMNLLRNHGHKIVYDWTINFSENDGEKKATAERDAVHQADLVVYLWHYDAESARYEAGMAMGLGKRVIVSGGPDSFFFKLPFVSTVVSDDKIIEEIERIGQYNRF